MHIGTQGWTQIGITKLTSLLMFAAKQIQTLTYGKGRVISEILSTLREALQ